MTTPASLLPLGALSAGVGLLLAVPAQAQTSPGTPEADPRRADEAPPDLLLKPVTITERAERDADSLRAKQTTIGKGTQALRDIPQSVTVITDKLMEDRRVDTLKQALHMTAGVSFMAAEGGEEDIRLRGFSLAASGDIYVDSMRDPAFYDRDTFNFDRVELLRGSASMLFGRGSTGGVVNQVSKLPFLANANQIDATVGDAGFLRFTGDFNVKLGDTAAVRVNVMDTSASGHGGNDRLDKQGLAPTLRWGIGTSDEFYLSGYYLNNNNGINYGMPWLRQNGSLPVSASNPAGLVRVDPMNYYGAASDYSAGSASLATVGWTHRYADGGELKSAIRQGRYDRDQRAGVIRFVAADQIGANNIGDATVLTRGTQNKVQDMNTTYAQSDYSNKFGWFGVKHEVLSGIDLAHEVFNNYAMVVPAGVALTKSTTTLGTPDDGSGGVDESLRLKRRAASFDAKAAGVYFQDLVQIAPHWKLLGGLRWDYFNGAYQTYQTATSATVPVGTQLADRGRTDRLWSRRFGILYQPNERVSAYASYGTSFNTSGDTYQYDDLSKNTPPEGSVNYEVGVKADLFAGRLSSRIALFKSIKTNERNRDSESASPTNYLLSGERHATGLELELAGRITNAWEMFLSYAWIPDAKIDKGAPDGTTLTGGELVGQRPSLSPKNSGTVWTTYQLTPALRFGGGLNFRGSETPNRNPAGIVAPGYVTGDLLAEYTFSEAVAFKLNVVNVTNKLYADSIYTAHYVPGPGRSVQLTMSARF